MMYRHTSDKTDYERANHQMEIQDRKNLNVERIGSPGGLAFKQFCREHLPVEPWEWKNEEAMRRCNPESFSSYDFEVLGYEVDMRTSRDVSAFSPGALLDNDPDDDIIVMVWHRDSEDSLILLDWERTETLKSKVVSQKEYSGETPEKPDHFMARPTSELVDLGPDTAYMSQKPENPFSPDDRVEERGDKDALVAIVVGVLPPEQNTGACGVEMEDEAVNVASPFSLDEDPGNWETIHPALYTSYYCDQNTRPYTCKHSNLEFAEGE